MLLQVCSETNPMQREIVKTFQETRNSCSYFLKLKHGEAILLGPPRAVSRSQISKGFDSSQSP
jgi:hypothetical protein